MATALQALQERKALAASAALANAGKQSPQEVDATETEAEHEYAHLVAGANTILPDGKKLTFYGKPGGMGFYRTSLEGEIEWMESLCNMPGSQVTRVINNTPVPVRIDPAILQAAQDAAANTLLSMNPGVATMTANLGATLAGGVPANQQ